MANKKETTYLLINIQILASRYGISDKELSLSMRISDETFRRRKKKVSSFTLGEIELVAKKLHTTPEKLLGKPENLFN